MSEEIYFSIGQASEFLGISRDTIKFYEEKGLINPIKDDENRYRKYSMEEIHNLFLINFYRELDMEIKKIKEIKDSGYIEKVDSILEEQEDKLFIEIKKKKEILKKIKKTRQGYLNVINNIEKFSIRSLGPFKVLEEIEDIAMEGAGEVVEKYKSKIENSGISKRAHTLDNLLKEFTFNDMRILGEKHLVIKNIKNKEKGLFYEKCIYSVLKMPVIKTEKQGEEIIRKHFSMFKRKGIEMGVEYLGKVYLKIALGNFENGEQLMYLEAFMPIKS